MDNQNTDDLKIEREDKEIKQTNNLDIDDEDEKVKEKMTEDNEDLKEKNIANENINVGVKEYEDVDDEDNILDEVLDHEIDEEEIKGSTDDFNQTNDTVSLIFI